MEFSNIKKYDHICSILHVCVSHIHIFEATLLYLAWQELVVRMVKIQSDIRQGKQVEKHHHVLSN